MKTRTGNGMMFGLCLLALVCSSSFYASAQSASVDQNLTQKRDLAGVLGEVHYIRTLCNGASDQYWRNYMRDFLEHEASSPSRKTLYVRAFNNGFTYQKNSVFRCDANTAALEVKLARKGRNLAETLAVSLLN